MARARSKPEERREVDIVKLKNVRLSFPALFIHEFYEGTDTGKFSATFLIPKANTKLVNAVEKAIEKAINLQWPDTKNRPRTILDTLRDGDNEKYDGYEDCMALKATNTKRVTLLDRGRNPLTVEDEYDLMYAGCYVNASLEFNAGTDSYKKSRVWCNLRGVQFYKDGDRFGGGTPVDTDAEFDDFSDEDEDEDADDLLD